MSQLLITAGTWEVAAGTTDDATAYTLTHLVFSGSDFGRVPLPGAPDDHRRVLRRLEALQQRYLDRGDWDLLAELLLCARIAGRDANAPSAAWTALLAAVLPDGAVPGPHYDPQTASAMPDPYRRTLYLFRTSYHTALVAALAAVDGLPGPADQPTAPSGVPVRATAAMDPRRAPSAGWRAQLPERGAHAARGYPCCSPPRPWC
jgi:hypothetical protein